MNLNLEEDTDYQKYRGKCKEMSETLCLENPELTLVRGHYDCPMWGMQPHWWCVDKEGVVHDPTVKQFPFGGAGVGKYIPFDGMITCAECGKEIPEQDAMTHGNYGFCGHVCACRFVGL